MKLISLGLALFLLVGAAAADEGQALYNLKCATCHQQSGSGIAHAFPALAGDATLLGDDDGVVAVVLKGRGGMPSWGFFLNDQQVADILTYARSSWGNGAPPVTSATVAGLRKTMIGALQNPLGN
jgi:cytochrome c6